MAVDSKHPLYEKFFPKWKRTRDALDPDAVREAGVEYLPQLSGQTGPQYRAYQKRAFYYQATARTRQGITGLVFRKSSTVTLPTAARAAEIVEDVTMSEVPLDLYAERRFRELLTSNFGGTYVNLPEQGGPTARAYFVPYAAESIVNWRREYIDGKMTTLMVMLSEKVREPKEDDPYEFNEIEQFRKLSLEDGVFTVTLFRKGDSREWEIAEAIQPTFRGATLDFIPFAFDPLLEDPPLLPVADSNLDHYRMTADYRHGLHFTALPTPYVAADGYAPDELAIGSGEAWTIPVSDAKIGMLEFTGAGLGALADAIEASRRDMATLGARLLEADKREAETAETHRLRQGREQASVMGSLLKLNAELSQALTWALNMSAVAGDAVVECNNDLVDSKLSPEELREYTAAMQTGSISYLTYYELLQKGEIAREGVSAEEEQELIAASRPAPIPDPVDDEDVGEDRISVHSADGTETVTG